MQYVAEYNNFWELKEKSWSGAIDTLNDIENADLENAFMNLLEEIFIDRIPTDTEINDFIWFDRDYIYETLGLDENGEIPHEETELEKREESIAKLKSTDEFDDFCDDCDTCILEFCKTYEDCKAKFEDYWNQVTSIEEIISEWK